MKRIIAIGAGIVFIITAAQIVIALIPAKTKDENGIPYHSYKFFSDLPAKVYVNDRFVCASPATVSLNDVDPTMVVFAQASRPTNRHAFRADFYDDDIIGFAVRLSHEVQEKK